MTTLAWDEGGEGLPPPTSQGVGGSGPGIILLYIFLQCPAYGTVSIQKRIVLKAGHWGLGDKSRTRVGE